MHGHPVWPARRNVALLPAARSPFPSDRGHLWRQLAARFGLADPDPGAPLEDKLRVRARDIAEWIAGHQDRAALKRDLEAART